FFQEYDGAPREGQIIRVLSDEYGRERWSESSPTPWRDAGHLEEEPHPASSLGELQEIEPGWYVLTSPLDPISPQRSRGSIPRPLAGRTILWVDDRPDNNRFERTYLEQLGASSSQASSTAEALLHVQHNEIDLIISDLHRIENGERRERAGIELLDQLKSIAKSIDIIFYIGDRNKAPPEIASITADQRQTLFKLVESTFGTQPKVEEQRAHQQAPAPAVARPGTGRKASAGRHALVIGSQIEGL